MDAAGTQLHPFGDPARWSAQQLIEHLILTYRSTAHSLQIRLDKGRPTQAPVTIFQRSAQMLVLKLGWYPPGMKAPAPVCPEQAGGNPLSGEQLAGEQLAQNLRQELQAMDQLLDECALRFGKQRVASHFALGALTVDQWRCFHTFHGRHHLKQLERIRAHISIG
jgi:hypothetical protein